MMRRRPPILALLIASAFAAGDVATSIASEPEAMAAQSSKTEQHVQAGPVTLDLAADASTINVAQSLTITLTLTAPTGIECGWPANLSPGEKLGTWSIASVSDTPAKALAGSTPPSVVRVRRIRLDPFLAGDYTLPAIEVPWKSLAGAESGVARTQPLTTAVTSLLPAPQPGSPDDPKELDPGTLREEFTPTTSNAHRVMAVGGTLAAVCLFGIIGARWAKRRHRRERDPVDAAFALVSASRDVPRDAESLGRACDDFASALRTALGDRIDPRAASLTPSELASLVSLREALSEGRSSVLIDLLERLDALRFSGSLLPGAEFESLRGTVTDLVGTLHALPRRDAGGAS